MNGRVYCPLTAQFFSPDPFVQAPHKWLNYNRYSYAWNNPLTFTDPTGERNHADNLTPDKRMHSVRGRIDIAGLEPGSAWNKRHFPAPWQRTNNHAGFPSFVFSGSDLSGSSSFSASGHNNQQSFMMGAGNFQQIVGNDNFRWIVEHGGEDWTFIEDLTILLPEVSISRHRVPARAQSGREHDWGNFWNRANTFIGLGFDATTVIGDYMETPRGFRGGVSVLSIATSTPQAIQDWRSLQAGQLHGLAETDAIVNVISVFGKPGAITSLSYHLMLRPAATQGAKGMMWLERGFRNYTLQQFQRFGQMW